MTLTASQPTDAHPLELLTGNPLVDEEHATLRRMIAGLHRTCPDFHCKDSCHGCGHGNQEACEQHLSNCLEDLLHMMVFHFHSEESLMRQIGFAQKEHEAFNDHVEAHAALSGELCSMTMKLGNHPPVRQMAHVAEVISNWLEDHIQTYDLPMVEASR